MKACNLGLHCAASLPFAHLSPSLNPLSGIADPHLLVSEQLNPTGFNNSDRQQIRGEPGQPCAVFTAGENQSGPPTPQRCFLCAPAECQPTEGKHWESTNETQSGVKGLFVLLINFMLYSPLFIICVVTVTDSWNIQLLLRSDHFSW